MTRKIILLIGILPIPYKSLEVHEFEFLKPPGCCEVIQPAYLWYELDLGKMIFNIDLEKDVNEINIAETAKTGGFFCQHSIINPNAVLHSAFFVVGKI